MIDRYHLLVFGGLCLKVNSPHHDLWDRVLQAVAILGKQCVQVTKCSSHEDIASAQLAVDEWLVTFNDVADRVAKTTNLERSGSFWALWQEHVTFVHQRDSLAEVVRGFQVAVNRRWLGSTVDDEEKKPAVPATKSAKIFPHKWQCEGPVLDLPRAVVSYFGCDLARVLQGWWNGSILFSHADTKWVSFTQLYIDFQLTCHHPGVIRESRRWADASALASVPQQYSIRCRL